MRPGSSLTNRGASGRPNMGYHHGQIKLALKVAGQPLGDDEAGPITWHVLMDKHHPARSWRDDRLAEPSS
ncbi:MAG: hypothetical protein ABIQ52_16305 [Vicinamibacterales bacterium]